MKSMKKAFSLIEIIFVIVILGIIISFAAPKLMDTKDSALVSTLKRDITTTINAVQSYYLLNQKIDDLEDVLTIGTTNWDVDKLSMKDKNSCLRLDIINSLNGVKLELIVDPIKDIPICKKLRESGVESKTYDVY